MSGYSRDDCGVQRTALTPRRKKNSVTSVRRRITDAPCAQPHNLPGNETDRAMHNSDRILDDIRVLDLSQEVAGPLCTKFLAGLGAEVLKVEPPGTGDASRRFGPFVLAVPAAEQSALFLYLNTGKKSITLECQS